MSTPPQDPSGGNPAPGYDDRTRDIRLPSLPDRPSAAVRPEWQAHVRPTVADPAPAPAEQTEEGGGKEPDATPAVSAARSPEPSPPRPYVLPDEPTDELSSPPQVRQQTVAFDAPAGAPAPWAPPVPGTTAPGPGPAQFGAPPFGSPSSGAAGSDRPSSDPPPSYGPSGRGSEPDRKRRWPWVVLTVLPILVIVAAALLLLVLLRGA